ncbi:hypothetical protein VFPPC_14563 [Pochonia chlamydosporia 170]|uniref:2EXR domain-containing protein n=1 Tax=Pochonia chlamydosporia 170 TaxID=1380566 RepID=A0A179F8H1_METCM|nr:hypothetical protein VFPPC_14563 [Pochonia chlamydosporia 170]OAQ61399.1 hypothetical protein VFPPC_14563 [Pochonia chlamydosporia 170]
MAFHNFGALPLEIRQSIWLFSLPMPEPEVCLMWPVNLYQRYEGPESTMPSEPYVVDTAFPVLMHVCRESRAMVQNSTLSGVLFRSSTLAGCAVPFRYFDPELDTMYWGSENIIELARNSMALPDVFAITSLAIEVQWGFRLNLNLIDTLMDTMSDLQTLSLVLPDSTDNNRPRVSLFGHEAFKQPSRRCKLRTIDSQKQPIIHIETSGDRIVANDDLVPLPLALQQCREALERGAAALLAESAAISGIVREGPDTRRWFNHLRIQAQTFIEYQPDGTWKEICGERRFVDQGRTYMLGPYIPVAERPNPELVRVNDLDGALKKVYMGD